MKIVAVLLFVMATASAQVSTDEAYRRVQQRQQATATQQSAEDLRQENLKLKDELYALKQQLAAAQTELAKLKAQNKDADTQKVAAVTPTADHPTFTPRLTKYLMTLNPGSSSCTHDRASAVAVLSRHDVRFI